MDFYIAPHKDIALPALAIAIIGREIEKISMNQCTKPIQKEVMGNDFCYRKVGKAITYIMSNT